MDDGCLVVSRIQHRLQAAGHSLAGDGMLLRLRNASIALVAAVAAVGLGLTLFIAQLGFPGAFSGPIPGSPAKVGTVHDSIALTHSPGVAPSRSQSGARSGVAASTHPRRAGNGGTPGVGGSHRFTPSPQAQPGPVASQPASSVPVSEPTASPTAPPQSPAAATPTPVAAGATPTGTSNGGSKPNASAAIKAASDGSKSVPSTTVKSKADKDGGQSVSVAKSNASPAEKAAKDQSTASSPQSAAAPTAAASPASEVSNPAAAKEAADSGH